MRMHYDEEAPIDMTLSDGTFYEVYDADAPLPGNSFRTCHVLRLGCWVGDDEVGATDIPYPPLGFGGGQLFASPSERYVLFAMWSGQNEERYELFEAATLEKVGAVPYQSATNATLAFSTDEVWLAMAYFHAVPWDPWLDQVVSVTEDGISIVDSGGVQLLDLRSCTLSSHRVECHLASTWRAAAGQDSAYALEPRFVNGCLELAASFGSFSFPLPAPAVLPLELR